VDFCAAPAVLTLEPLELGLLELTGLEAVLLAGDPVVVAGAAGVGIGADEAPLI